MRVCITLLLAWACGFAYAGDPALPPAFTRKPVATREGGQVRIEFAVNRETDVAVYIENAKGAIVRHLVAGMLGQNPPEPLKPNSLEQVLVWDGKDDDGREVLSPSKERPADDAPFKVGVGLGLKAGYAGTAFSEHQGPNLLTNVEGLGIAADGRLYVMDNRSGWLYAPSYAVHVFRRDGSYEKTIKPFPSHLPPERLKPTGAFKNERGFLNPIIHRTLAMTFYPYEDVPAAQMAVTPDGRLILAVVPTQSSGRGDTPDTAAHLAALDLDGGIAGPDYAGPALGKGLAYQGNAGVGGARMAASPENKYVYLVNIGNRIYDKSYLLKKHHAVYRVPLPAMGPAEVFFGDKDTPGADEKHLNEPMSLAVDGKGHLLIADSGNNRVLVLNEAGGQFVGSFAVDAPQWIGVHLKSGAVYVHSKNRLVKYSGWKNAQEVAALELGTPALRSDQAPPLSFALDGSAEPAVLWMGQRTGKPALQRCEDQGSRFSKLEPAQFARNPRQWRPASDPTHRLVACRVDEEAGSALQVLDEATGQVKKVRVSLGQGNNQGITSRLDREGAIYSSSASGGIWKCDPSGKCMPFPATAQDPKLKGHLPAGSTGTTAWERDWCVDRRGEIYAKVRGTQYHGLMHVDVFGPDGQFKRTAIWGVTDGAYGPRVDAQGHIYMMECVKPVGQPFPEEIETRVSDKWVRHWYDWMYGSIVKFGAEGGNLWLAPRDANDKPGSEPVKLPASVEKQKVYATFRKGESLLQGALWMHPGVAHCGDMGVWGGGEHCHCTACDFDVDNFSRTFAPDNGRQRVTVLDARGNVILHFGAYGNQDYCGAESFVLDPAEKFLRPRRPQDPPDLKSPFLDPEIGLNFVIGLAVAERYVYLTDCANRRTLRVRLEYTAEEKTLAAR